MNRFFYMFTVLAIAISFGFNRIAVNSYQTKKNSISIDKNKLLGDWVRTDADYHIKISEVNSAGKLKAGYFNPKSINVGKASWKNAKGIFKIYIELRDENYPGSNYNLTYNIEKDMLYGKYFQAVTGETYDVLFSRMK